jgi:hypothetical protein
MTPNDDWRREMRRHTYEGIAIILALVAFFALMEENPVGAQPTSFDPSLVPSKWFDITPTDTDATEFAVDATPNFLYTGSGGVIILEHPDDTETTFSNVPAGQMWRTRYVRVHATGTTATGLRGGY